MLGGHADRAFHLWRKCLHDSDIRYRLLVTRAELAMGSLQRVLSSKVTWADPLVALLRLDMEKHSPQEKRLLQSIQVRGDGSMTWRQR